MADRLRPLLLIGTRPEAIKMAPVISACRDRAETIEPIVCATGQHREMLDQVVQWFGIHVDEHLDLMTANQTLSALTARCVEGIDRVLLKRRPHCVVAQGDTTTVMAAALVAFYHRLPFVHVEAGLRTGNLQAPWPEELNRRIADVVAALYCAPTRRAADCLLAEGVDAEKIRVTGNTVVDALLDTLKRLQPEVGTLKQKYAMLGDCRTVLITGHRREYFGPCFENICRATAMLADRFGDCQFIYPVHLNPNVQKPVSAVLGNRKNVHLTPPLPYPEFVWLMERSTLIMTDSGGVQEEAPSLGKPVVVMREKTERPEGIGAGVARLAGTSVEAIIDEVSSLLSNPAECSTCRSAQNPYGDGHAAERILDWMLQQGWNRSEEGRTGES